MKSSGVSKLSMFSKGYTCQDNISEMLPRARDTNSKLEIHLPVLDSRLLTSEGT